MIGKPQVNLVPNYSFEQLTQCPTTNGQVYYAEPWFQPSTILGDVDVSSSSDIFNNCHVNVFPNDNMDVPLNAVGFQIPITGNGFAGIAFWLDNGLREYLMVPLNQTLIAGKSYCVWFYISYPGTAFGLDVATDALHLGFTPDSSLTSNYTVQNVVPAIQNISGNIITDSTNWIRICGSYIAQGWEKYLIIGNFFNNSNSGVNNPSGQAAYYYVEDVFVVESEVCNCNDSTPVPPIIPDEIYIPNVFSPNNDSSNDVFNIIGAQGNTHMEIYNRWGEKVYFADGNNSYWDGWTNVGIKCPDGVYFYIITIEEKTYKGYVHLLR